MPYVIRRTDGAYVAAVPSPSSYTKRLERARTFATKEAAERERCPENEHIMSVDSCLVPTNR